MVRLAVDTGRSKTEAPRTRVVAYIEFAKRARGPRSPLGLAAHGPGGGGRTDRAPDRDDRVDVRRAERQVVRDFAGGPVSRRARISAFLRTFPALFQDS